MKRAVLLVPLLFATQPAWALDLPKIGSPWSPLGVFGGFLIGMCVGCGGVAAYVLASENATTNKTKRYIECAIAFVSLIVGVALVAYDSAG
jgi:hypothetical protein